MEKVTVAKDDRGYFVLYDEDQNDSSPSPRLLSPGPQTIFVATDPDFGEVFLKAEAEARCRGIRRVDNLYR